MDIRSFFTKKKTVDVENAASPSVPPASLALAATINIKPNVDHKQVDSQVESEFDMHLNEPNVEHKQVNCQILLDEKQQVTQMSVQLVGSEAISVSDTRTKKRVSKGSLTTPKTKRPKKSKPCVETVPKLTASHFHPKDPRLAKLSVCDVKMVSKRRLRDKQDDVPYDIELVPAALGCSMKALCADNEQHVSSAMLSESVLLKVEGQEAWTCTEMLQLCSEAAWRRVLLDRERGLGGGGASVTADPKPLTLEYICDRLDTDDPIFGYQMRHASTGWLQGFVTYTVFTTWSPYFRFDSNASSCGITADDYEHRAVDKTGEISTALQMERRWGDPAEEGIVFDKVAEVSLLGGLGCGAWLLCLTLEEMREKGFNWVVLQATDQAIPFYENMGFVRVGCVARHPSKEAEESESEPAVKKKGKKDEKEVKKVKKPKPTLSDCSPVVPADCPREDRYYWLAVWMMHLVTSWKALDYDAVFSVPVSLEEVPDYKHFIPHEPMDLSLMQRKAVDFRYPHLAALVADLHKLVDNALAFNGKASPIALLAKSLRSKALSSVRKLMVEERDVAHSSRDLSEVAWPTECWLFQPPSKQASSPNKQSIDMKESVLEKEDKTETKDMSEAEEVFCDPSDTVVPLTTQEREDKEHLEWLQSAEGLAFALRISRSADKDKHVLGYVHWTFPDQTVEDQYPSYMMARRLSPEASPPSIGLTRPSEVSPEVAAGFPRGVTPRGDTFVGKFASASGCDYLGSFTTLREAKASYNDAKDDAASQVHEKRALKPAPPCDTLLKDVHKWMVEETPTIVAKRMATSEVDSQSEADSQTDTQSMDTSQEVTSSPTAQAVPATVGATVGAKKGKKRPIKEKLYNKLVTVKDQPPCYPHKYWFVYQYVPDMEWCHLCPVQQAGVFKNGKRQGRPRFKLVPEGRAREMDVPASRCTLVKSEQCVHTSSADQEIFDIIDI